MESISDSRTMTGGGGGGDDDDGWIFLQNISLHVRNCKHYSKVMFITQLLDVYTEFLKLYMQWFIIIMVVILIPDISIRTCWVFLNQFIYTQQELQIWI